MGTINIIVEKKVLKLWYKRNKITLQDISLSKLTKPKGVHDTMSIGTLEVIPIDAFDDESTIIDTTDDTTLQENMTQDVHQTIK